MCDDWLVYWNRNLFVHLHAIPFMMQLKLLEVQELAHLQMQLINLTTEIEQLTGIGAQLANDHCSVNITFMICNETKAEEAKAKKEMDDMMMDPMEKAYKDYMVNDPMRGIMAGVKAFLVPDQRAGIINRSFKFSEADALRVMSVAIENKKQQRKEIIERMRTITRNQMPAMWYLNEDQPVKE